MSETKVLRRILRHKRDEVTGECRILHNEELNDLHYSMTAALEAGEWSAARPGRTLPSGKTQYPFYRRLGGPRTGLDGRNISSPPGFDPGPSRS